jgi:hypothetical protein
MTNLTTFAYFRALIRHKAIPVAAALSLLLAVAAFAEEESEEAADRIRGADGAPVPGGSA